MCLVSNKAALSKTLVNLCFLAFTVTVLFVVQGICLILIHSQVNQLNEEAKTFTFCQMTNPDDWKQCMVEFKSRPSLVVLGLQYFTLAAIPLCTGLAFIRNKTHYVVLMRIYRITKSKSGQSDGKCVTTIHPITKTASSSASAAQLQDESVSSISSAEKVDAPRPVRVTASSF